MSRCRHWIKRSYCPSCPFTSDHLSSPSLPRSFIALTDWSHRSYSSPRQVVLTQALVLVRCRPTRPRRQERYRAGEQTPLQRPFIPIHRLRLRDLRNVRTPNTGGVSPSSFLSNHKHIYAHETGLWKPQIYQSFGPFLKSMWSLTRCRPEQCAVCDYSRDRHPLAILRPALAGCTRAINRGDDRGRQGGCDSCGWSKRG